MRKPCSFALKTVWIWRVVRLVGRSTTRGTIIVFNGNAGNRSYRGTLAARLTQAGFDVLLFDYRGYGGNAGSPSEDGLAADARAARAYLARRSA